MKQYLVALLALLMTSCAYQYSIGVNQDVPADEAATLIANFNFHIVEIDGVQFKEKFSMSAVGTNTIRLAPGVHTVKFMYCDCNLNSQRWVEGYLYLTKDMRAGKTYRMKMITTDRKRAKFEIIEETP